MPSCKNGNVGDLVEWSEHMFTEYAQLFITPDYRGFGLITERESDGDTVTVQWLQSGKKLKCSILSLDIVTK